MGPCTSWNPSQCQFQRAGLSWFIQPHFPTYNIVLIHVYVAELKPIKVQTIPRASPKHIKPQIIQTSSPHAQIFHPPIVPQGTSPAAPVSAARGWHRSCPRSAESPAWPVRRPHCACGRRSGPCHRPGASASWVGPGRTSGPGWRVKGDPGEEGKMPWVWMGIIIDHGWGWLIMIDNDW